MKRRNEVKYLGCEINDKADIRLELNKRISATIDVLKKLDIFSYTVTVQLE